MASVMGSGSLQGFDSSTAPRVRACRGIRPFPRRRKFDGAEHPYVRDRPQSCRRRTPIGVMPLVVPLSADAQRMRFWLCSPTWLNHRESRGITVRINTEKSSVGFGSCGPVMAISFQTAPGAYGRHRPRAFGLRNERPGQLAESCDGTRPLRRDRDHTMRLGRRRPMAISNPGEKLRSPHAAASQRRSHTSRPNSNRCVWRCCKVARPERSLSLLAAFLAMITLTGCTQEEKMTPDEARASLIQITQDTATQLGVSGWKRWTDPVL